MTNSVAALRYLIARTTANRLTSQGKRLKRPRYLFFLVFGIGYFWLFFFGGFRGRGNVNQIGTSMVGVGGMLVAVSIVMMWLLGRTSASLAFQPAEVQLLFPAPLTRRQLIAYRVVRSQLIVLLNAFIWMFLSARFGSIAPPVQRFAAAWGLFSVLGLHPLALALVGVQPISGLRRGILWGFKALAVAVLAGGAMLVRSITTAASEGSKGIVATVAEVSSQSPAKYFLAPFRALIAPFLAPDLHSFASAFAIVLGLIGLHLVWVLSMNTEFEEMAAVASVKVASQRSRLRAFQGGGTAFTPTAKTARSWLPLSPTGIPAVAIVWKNTLALVRTRMLFSLLLPAVMVVVVTRVSLANAKADSGDAAAPFLIFVLMLFMMGPRILRNDLRQDLLSLTSLKTYPLSGSTMVTAQILSPSLLLTAMQVVMAIVALISIPASAFKETSAFAIIAATVLVPSALFVLNALNVAIQNGTVLLFPAWVRLGPTAGGIEAMGQNLVMTFGSLFALVLTVIAPSIVGGIAFYLTSSVMDGTAIAAVLAATVGALVILAIELWLMMLWLGRVFDRTEATAVTQ